MCDPLYLKAQADKPASLLWLQWTLHSLPGTVPLKASQGFLVSPYILSSCPGLITILPSHLDRSQFLRQLSKSKEDF